MRAYIVFVLFFLSTLSPRYVYAQSNSDALDEYVSLASEYEGQGNASQAALYYSKAANGYWQRSNTDKAVAYFTKALSNTQKVGNYNGLKVINTNLGLIYSQQENHAKAAERFAEALNAARKIDKSQEVATCLLNLSNEQIELQDYATAERSLTELQQIAQELNNQYLLRNCYLNFSKLYEKQGDKRRAEEYFGLYAMLTKKIQSDEVRAKESKAKAMVDSAGRVVQQLSVAKTQADRKLEETNQVLRQKDDTLRAVEKVTREQQMQIDLLNAEMKLREADLKHQKLLQHVYIGLFIVALLFLALLLYAYNQKKKANKLLSEKNVEIMSQKEEISLQAAQLRDLNGLKDKVFSIIAHDLRSPLFSLITMLNIAKEGYFTEESFKSVIAELSINVNHTTSLLENLLTWARTQMHGTKVNPVNFNFNDLVNSRIAMLEERAAQKNIAIRNQLNQSLFVWADKDLTEIVFRNLVSNAIKFCNAGDKVEIWCTVSDGLATICVEDTGVGIHPDVMRKLFGTQVSSTPGTRNEKGTGLGLILCKEFVELNGGQIWAESQPDKGSKFFFTMPVAKLD